jgi:hypothetical protein
MTDFTTIPYDGRTAVTVTKTRNRWKKRCLAAEAEASDLRVRLGHAVSLTVIFGVIAAAALLFHFTR